MAESKNIFQRMNAVMQEVEYVQKEKKAGMRYSIVSHDAVTAKVRPLMVKHGIIYFPVRMQMEQNGNRTQAHIAVRFQNIDEPDDYMDVQTAGYGIDDQDKGPGKAISYSVKYALLKALGLESGDDPDEDQVSEHKSDAYDELLLSIEDCTDLEILEVTIAGNIAAASKKVSPAQLQMLRSKWTQKKRELKGTVNA